MFTIHKIHIYKKSVCVEMYTTLKKTVGRRNDLQSIQFLNDMKVYIFKVTKDKQTKTTSVHKFIIHLYGVIKI